MATSLNEEKNRYLINLEKLRRYRPDLSLILQNTTYSYIKFFINENGEKNLKHKVAGNTFNFYSTSHPFLENCEWWENLQIKDDVVAIVYGVGLGYFYMAAKKWLKVNPSNRLVIIEDDLGVIQKFLETKLASEMLEDPQVLLQYMRNSTEDQNLLQQIILSCFEIPFFDVQFSLVVSPCYAKRKKKSFEALVKQLLFIMESFQRVKEALWGDKPILKNYYSNLFSLPQVYIGNNLAQKFVSIPAIICGGGPSLKKQVESLKKIEDKALIFAGGAAINILDSEGIVPHFCVGIDPNESHYARILTQSIFEVPFFFSYRMHHQALQVIQGPKLLLAKHKVNFEDWFNQEFKLKNILPQGGVSVGNTSVELAYQMGCNPLIFVGMDLALTNHQLYAEGVLDHPLVANRNHYHFSPVPMYQDQDLEGNPILTTFQFLQETEWLSHYAQVHLEKTFINASEGGRAIEGIMNQSLEKALAPFDNLNQDLRGRIHQEIQNISSSKLTLELVRTAGQKWKKSYEKCHLICLDILTNLQPFLEHGVVKEEFLPNHLVSHLALKELELLAEEAYQNHIAHFDQHASSVLKAQENQWISKQGWNIGGERLKLNLDNLSKRYTFLENFIKTNLELIQEQLLMTQEGINQGKVIQKEEITEPFFNQKFPSKKIRKIEEFYPSGMIKSITSRKDGLMHGLVQFFSENGKVISSSCFHDGLKDGEVLQYYFSGGIYSKQIFKNGKRNGEQHYYYEDGSLKSFLSYQNGLLHGEVVLFYSNGNRKLCRYFEQGKKQGKEEIWYESGQKMMEIHYQNDLPIGTGKSWDPDGNLLIRLVLDNNQNILSIEELENGNFR